MPKASASSGKEINSSDMKRQAAEKRDELVFAERKTQEALNLAKTARLRALRLAHEASLAEQASLGSGKAAASRRQGK